MVWSETCGQIHYSRQPSDGGKRLPITDRTSDWTDTFVWLFEILGQMVLLHQMFYRDIYQSARNHCNDRGAYTTPFRHKLGVTGSIEKKDLVKR